jgi:hypothetical protein
MTGTWFCLCASCGLIYVAPVKTEGQNCQACTLKQMKAVAG